MNLFTAIVLLFPSLQDSQAPANPALEKFRKEEAEDLARTGKELAEKHFKLGKWCEKNKMNRRARFHYLRAISHHPDHEGARKELGYKKTGGAWAAPKESAFRFDDEEKIAPQPNKEDVTAEWKSFQVQFQPLLQFRAEKDMKLADKAKKAGLAVEEARILRRIVEYWPDCVEARDRLKDQRTEREGYTDGQGKPYKAEPIWVRSPFEKLYQDIKIDGPLKEKSEEEAKIPIPMISYQTEHFRMSAVFPEDRALAYLRAAEAGFRFIQSLCPDLKMPRSNFPIRLYTVMSRDDLHKVIEALIRVGPKEVLNHVSRGNFRDPLRWIEMQEDLTKTNVDQYLHHGAEYAIAELFPRIPAWFQEGLAYLTSLELNGTCHTTCLSFDKGSQVEVVDHWRQPNAWRDLLLESVMLGEEPASKEIFNASFSKLRSRGGVKAWSLVHFLYDRDPQAFSTLLKDMAGKIDPAVVIERIYKLDARGLDQEWRDWALKSY